VELNIFAMQDADRNIIKWLKDHGRLVHHSTVAHSYPFCWRCVIAYIVFLTNFQSFHCVVCLYCAT